MSGDVLVLSGVTGDTRRYRTFHLYEQLQLAGVRSRLTHITDPAILEKAGSAAVIVLHRTPFDPLVGRLVQMAGQRRVMLIADVDDLIFEPEAVQWIDSPDFQDPVRAALYQEDISRHRQMLKACTAALASTGFLAKQIEALGKPAWVHRNGFSQEMLALSEAAVQGRSQPASQIVLGYASGTPTHDRDFQVVKPALLETLRRFESAELWLIGPLNPGTGWGKTAERVRQIPFVPWRQLPDLLSQFDVNLAPLVAGNPFAQSKSEIKFMEAALVRVPTIASPTAAFRHAIAPGQNGLLAATEREWREALAALVEDPDLRRSLGRQAYETTLESYHPRKRSAEILATLSQLFAELHGDQTPDSLIDPGVDRAAGPGHTALQSVIGVDAERTPSLIRMGLYNLRYRGAGTLLRRVWVYFRRLLAPIFPFPPPSTAPEYPAPDDEVEDVHPNSAS